jgi:hypothetical protein
MTYESEYNALMQQSVSDTQSWSCGASLQASIAALRKKYKRAADPGSKSHSSKSHSSKSHSSKSRSEVAPPEDAPPEDASSEDASSPVRNSGALSVSAQSQPTRKKGGGRKTGSKNKPKNQMGISDELHVKQNADRRYHRKSAFTPWKGCASNILIESYSDIKEGRTHNKISRMLKVDASNEINRVAALGNLKRVSLQPQICEDTVANRAHLQRHIAKMVNDHKLPITQHRQVDERYQMRISNSLQEIIEMDKDVYERAHTRPLVWRDTHDKEFARIGITRRLWLGQADGEWIPFDHFVAGLEYCDLQKDMHVAWHAEGDELDFRKENLVLSDHLDAIKHFPFLRQIRVQKRNEHELSANWGYYEVVDGESRRKNKYRIKTFNPKLGNDVRRKYFAYLVMCLGQHEPKLKTVRRKRSARSLEEGPLDEEPQDEEPQDEESQQEEAQDEESQQEEPQDEESQQEEPLEEEPLEEEALEEEAQDEASPDEQPCTERRRAKRQRIGDD